jgi:hypothetical protein
MGRKVFTPLAEGFSDALRLFAAILLAPIRVLADFVRQDSHTKKPAGRSAGAH